MQHNSNHGECKITQTSINYSLSSHEHIVFAKTSLASRTNQPRRPAKIPEEFDKFLNSNSVQWIWKENIPIERLAIASQVHGNDVKYINSPGVYEDIDGFYTDCPDIYLTIRTADCAAIFVSVPEIPAVGIAHAGWRGTKANIVGNLIFQMTERWSIDPALFRVAVSPYIKQCCYSVGEEFREYFEPRYLRRDDNRLFLDLEKVIVDQLITSNIKEENITVSQDCTSCTSLPLYSYRAQQKTSNRLLSIISIPKQ